MSTQKNLIVSNEQVVESCDDNGAIAGIGIDIGGMAGNAGNTNDSGYLLGPTATDDKTYKLLLGPPSTLDHAYITESTLNRNNSMAEKGNIKQVSMPEQKDKLPLKSNISAYGSPLLSKLGQGFAKSSKLPSTIGKRSEQSFKDFLSQKGLHSDTIETLVREGFTDETSLSLLSETSTKELQIPMADRLRLDKLIRGSFQHTSSHPNDPVANKHDYTAGFESLAHLLGKGSQPGTRTSAPTHTYSDPLMYLSTKGLSKKYYDISDFIPGFLTPRQMVVAQGSEGHLIYDSVPQKPSLQKVTQAQWAAASAKILAQLMDDGKLVSVRHIKEYLAYTVKIAELGNRFDWTSVLQYDRNYRELQATTEMPWGSDTPHLHSLHLREKVVPDYKNLNKAKYDVKGKKAQAPIDPKNGRQICLKFNSGKCPHGTNCIYSHICLLPTCGQTHPKVAHPQ